MKEVKKCSISGVAFTMDTDAYQELEAYLESLKKTYKETPDGAEIVADIEARIAELILSAQDSTRVVEKPLILNIIRQMGTAEDISEEEPGRSPEEPRIPRRLYRDTENAKLGGVCAGIGKYFDVDPVWIRLAMFLPILLTVFQWIPFMRWTGPMMGNLFGIFVICYIIMWFAVPAPRTARQKLEMNGEKITAQSIRETTEASASCDPDAKAKPIVAEAVSVFGKVVLILLKLFAGVLVFGLIMAACALIIGLFALIIGGASISIPFFPLGMTLWVPALGILIVLILVILLIYVLMCLIASRKPGGKTILVNLPVVARRHHRLHLYRHPRERRRPYPDQTQRYRTDAQQRDNHRQRHHDGRAAAGGVRQPERHRGRPQNAAYQRPEPVDRHYDRQGEGRTGGESQRQTGESADGRRQNRIRKTGFGPTAGRRTSPRRADRIKATGVR